MKNIITMLVIMFGLSGCFYQEANSVDITKALAYCEDKGGIEYITVWMSGFESLKCLGSKDVVYLRDIVLGEKK